MFTGIIGFISALSAGYSLVRQVINDVSEANDNDHTKHSLKLMSSDELKQIVQEEIHRREEGKKRQNTVGFVRFTE